MALLNRFSKLNDRGETGIFTFIVTKSVTRDLHRDATTKDFCFGYHRWAISFQRPTDKMLGVHLLLRNASPNTACVVDFTLALLNREHFSQNQVYSKRQAKFTITNPMQGVSRWIELSELAERRFSNETGEFLFELSLSNMTTIFECDIQLSAAILNQYKQMLKFGCATGATNPAQLSNKTTAATNNKSSGTAGHHHHHHHHQKQLINLETNNFTFGSFEWSLTIVPLVVSSGSANAPLQLNSSSASSSQDSFSLDGLNGLGNSSGGGAAAKKQHKAGANPLLADSPSNLEPVCRVYLNRLNGFDSLCRVKYRVILGHHQPGGAQSAEFVDSKQLDQISDCRGRIRGHQFRQTNMLKLISLRHQQAAASQSSQTNPSGSSTPSGKMKSQQAGSMSGSSSVDLRVHIEMFCANTISEARVPIARNPNEAQVSNCSDRNKQAWCVESDSDSGDLLKLKLFFMDLQSVPRNHIRYISWIAHLVRRDPKTGQTRDSLAVKNSPHSNYYLQDGIDLGAMMETDIQVEELNRSPKAYLESGMLTVHIEWIDSLLLFSHLYNNYDALATVQRHQISRELLALQQEFDYLEGKYLQAQRTLSRLSNGSARSSVGNDEAGAVATTAGNNKTSSQVSTTQKYTQLREGATTSAAETSNTASRRVRTTPNEFNLPRYDFGDREPTMDETLAAPAEGRKDCGDRAMSLSASDRSDGGRTDRVQAASGGRSLSGPFRELEEEICLIGAGESQLRFEGAMSLANQSDDQRHISETSEPQSQLGYTTPDTTNTPEFATSMLQQQQQQQQHNNLKLMLDRQTTLPDNDRCSSSLSLGDHQSGSQPQGNYAGQHFSGRLSGDPATPFVQRPYHPVLGAATSSTLNFSGQGLSLGKPMKTNTANQLQAGITGRKSSSIRRRLPQPNVSGLTQQQLYQQQRQSDRPSSALLPSSDANWLSQSALYHRASSGSFDASTAIHHQQQRGHMAMHRRQSPASCSLADDDDGVSSLLEGGDPLAACDASMENSVDLGFRATFNRIQQPRHSADSVSGRFSGTCSPGHHPSLNSSIRPRHQTQVAASTGSPSLIQNTQQRLRDGRLLDEPPGQFYQLIESDSNSSSSVNINSVMKSQHRHPEVLLDGAHASSGYSILDREAASSDNNEDPRDHRLNSKNAFVAEHGIMLDAGSRQSRPSATLAHPFGQQDCFMERSEHQDNNKFSTLPLECLTTAQQQQLGRRETSVLDRAARLPSDSPTTVISPDEHHTLLLAQAKPGLFNPLARPTRNGLGDSPPTPGIDNQLVSMRGQANPLGDGSVLKSKPAARLMEQHQYDAFSKPFEPTLPPNAQNVDRDWLDATNQRQLRRL